MGHGGTDRPPYWTVVALVRWAAESLDLIDAYLASHGIDVTGWPTRRLLDLLWAMPIALGQWVDKAEEFFPKYAADLNDPLVITARDAAAWGTTSATEAAFDDVAADWPEPALPADYDPAKPFEPSYGGAASRFPSGPGR